MKGLSYAPTGAIMAAGTTSLPETPGGERNWDYRYTWIRDTAFMLRALHDLGFEWEAFEYFAFLLETLAAEAAPGAWDLQIMYGIGGETDLTEHTLDHLSGYRNSRPVRIGNGAFDQHQHDVWGMLLDAVATHQRRGGQIPAAVWEGICYFVDQAIERFPEPDQGIWEMRGDPQHFVASKVMCWVAVDRGLRLARVRDDDEHIERWEAAAEKMRAEILEQGVDDRGVFTQHYGTQGPRRVEPADPDHGLPPGRRRARARHGARHRRRAHQGRPGAALPRRHHRRRPLGRGGHVHHLLVLAGVRAHHHRRDRPGPGAVPEAAVVRRAAAPLRRGDRRAPPASTSGTSRRRSPTSR